VRYQAEDKPTTTQAARTRGVSSLLQGTKTVLMPEHSERMARRRLHVVSKENGGHRNGCCGGNS
jgi:hypothetical protein